MYVLWKFRENTCVRLNGTYKVRGKKEGAPYAVIHNAIDAFPSRYMWMLAQWLWYYSPTQTKYTIFLTLEKLFHVSVYFPWRIKKKKPILYDTVVIK